MSSVSAVEIANYRSVGHPVRIELPARKPLVLVGENNAGKSNIVRALDLTLGTRWPTTRDLEDHEFFERDRTKPIAISVEFARSDPLAGTYTDLLYRYDGDEPFFGVGPSQYPTRDYDYVRREIREACVCIVVEADRNLNYHLGYASKFTLLSKLMHQFHKALLGDAETKAQLEGLFERVKERFEQIHAFADFSRTLREQLTDLSAAMTHQLEVDFQAYNPVNFFRALRLQAVEEGEPRTLEELGTGEQQILALSFAYAYATAFHGGLLLVIEEPEAHLHPLAQRWLARRINQMCAGGLQVILTTHSPHFIDLLNLDSLVLVKKEHSTEVVQVSRAELVRHCESTGATTSVDTILPHYAYHSTPEILEGFFAKVVVLVEGKTETLALPAYLEKVRLDVVREGIAILGVGGKGNLAKWRRLFTAFSIPTYVVFDNDGRRDDMEGIKRRDALRSVGIPAENDADYIDVDDWLVEAQVAVFGQNFEQSMRRVFVHYGELEAQAATEGISEKPFVARWVAERLQLFDEEGWELFRRMARAVGSLVPGAEPPRNGGQAAGSAAGAEEDLEERLEMPDELPF